MDRYTIVSIDSHVSPRAQDLRPYCTSAYRDRFDEWAAQWTSLWGDEQNWYGEGSPIAARWGFPFKETVKTRTRELVERAGAGVYDAAARVRDMEADGIAAELFYHTAFTRDIFPFQRGSVFGPGARELELVGIQIYNRWAADFVAGAPERLIGAAYIPVWDVDATVAELTWAREHGLRCVNFPAPDRSFPGYNDPVYEPLWAACVDLDLTLTTHGGAGDMPDYTGKEAWALYCSDLFYYSRRGLHYLIWSGVFERYPRLKLLLTEQRSGWVRETLAELDSIYFSDFQDLSQLLPRPPSEYFRDHVHLGVSFMSRFEAEARHEVGVDRLLWGSDYPHFEGTWGYTELSLRNTFSGLPAAEVERILGANAIDLFGLDGTALRAIGDRIGPRVDAIAQPVDHIPDVPGQAFRRIGSWS
jgi:predicted TIM-barrel fold metal-dependent hydrolase